MQDEIKAFSYEGRHRFKTRSSMYVQVCLMFLLRVPATLNYFYDNIQQP